MLVAMIGVVELVEERVTGSVMVVITRVVDPGRVSVVTVGDSVTVRVVEDSVTTTVVAERDTVTVSLVPVTGRVMVVTTLLEDKGPTGGLTVTVLVT